MINGKVSALLLLASLGACVVLAQNYGIGWHTIDGGGGSSTGGGYSVTGTIGQPDASATPMTGGQYAVTGGFWAFSEVTQTADAPQLKIAASGAGRATIWWTPNDPGWILQESPDLAPSSWTNSPSGATNPVVVPATLPKKFYRLFKP